MLIVRAGAIPAALVPLDSAKREDTETIDGLNWWWLATCWGIAGLYVLAVCLAILRDWESGLVSLAAAVVATGASVLYWLGRRRKPDATGHPLHAKSSGPYRSAPANLIPQFLSHLAAVESELQRTGHEEEWDIDWAKHQLASQNAHSFLSHNRLQDALVELARAVDVLMTGVQLNRKNRQHQARWGKPPRPASGSSSSENKGG